MSDDLNGTGGPGGEGYSVGYGRPPKEHQFKKGQPSPRKGKKRREPSINIGERLDEPVSVVVNGRPLKRNEFEVRLSSLLKRGLKGNVLAIKQVLRYAERAAMFEVTPPLSLHPGVAYVPKDWDKAEWEENYRLFGPPPWKGERNGLIPEDRWDELIRRGRAHGRRDGRY